MLDGLKNHPLWRWFSELDTLSSLVTCIKVVVGVATGLVTGFWGWLNSQPGSIQFVLFLSTCLITISLINCVIWLRQKLASNRITRSPGKIAAGLYVCDMRFTFADLEKDRHSEVTMRVFNGTGSAVEFHNPQGQIKFNAPNDKDRDCMGTLPAPALRHDTTRTVAHLQESFLILTQQVPADEADKLLKMLAADIPIHFDLRELTIGVVGKHDRNRVERLPIWDGMRCYRSHCFGRVVHLSVGSTGDVKNGYR